MSIDEAIERVQFAYPQIYYACHTRHGRRRSTTFRLSARDAELLVHVDRDEGALVSELAHYLTLSRSTVSEALSKLATLSYVTKSRAPSGDSRHVRIRLTSAVVAAVRATSVLEPRRLRAVLGVLSERELRCVIRGLVCFSRACRSLPVVKSLERA